MKNLFNVIIFVIIFVVIFVLSLPLILCILIGYLWHLNSKVMYKNIGHVTSVILNIILDDDHL